ncbi:hypothetical protein Y024_4400 [Burkholderia pseudomallei TSV44]|nr:hypothetical protein Y024_4400 [Burkholderia pseudomallei TSV44]
MDRLQPNLHHEQTLTKPLSPLKLKSRANNPSPPRPPPTRQPST